MMSGFDESMMFSEASLMDDGSTPVSYDARSASNSIETIDSEWMRQQMRLKFRNIR